MAHFCATARDTGLTIASLSAHTVLQAAKRRISVYENGETKECRVRCYANVRLRIAVWVSTFFLVMVI